MFVAVSLGSFAQVLDVDIDCVGMSDLKDSSRKFTEAVFPEHQNAHFWKSMSEAFRAAAHTTNSGPTRSDWRSHEFWSTIDLCTPHSLFADVPTSMGKKGPKRRSYVS